MIVQEPIQKLAEIQLRYKNRIKPSLMPCVKSSRDAHKLLINEWDSSQIEFVEQFKVMLLNRANKVLGKIDVSSGSTTGTVVDPRLVLVAAMKANAVGIILAHNHPSGNLNPSAADIALTKKIKEASQLLEINLLDHLIVTTEGYYSFADEGIL